MASTAVALNPNDRITDLLGQSFEDQVDFFDQFVTFQPDAQGILDVCTSDDHSISWSSNNDTDPSESPDHGRLFYSESSGRAAISDTELLSFESSSILSPIISTETQSYSLPPSPSPATKKTYDAKAKTTKSLTEQSDRYLRSPIRKVTQPAARRARSTYTKLTALDAASNKISNLSDNKQQHQAPVKSATQAPPLPIPNAYRSRTSHSVECSFLATNAQVKGYTPVDTPALDDTYTPYQSTFENLTTPVTHQNRQSSLWSQLPGSDQLHCGPIGSPDEFQYLQESHPLWWSHAAAAPLAQPSPNVYHYNPPFPSKSLASQLSSDLTIHADEMIEAPVNMPAGLMILMDGWSTRSNYALPQDDPESLESQSYQLPQHYSPPASQTFYSSPTLDSLTVSPIITLPTRTSSPPSPQSSPSLTVRKTRPSTGTAVKPTTKASARRPISTSSAATTNTTTTITTTTAPMSPAAYRSATGSGFDFVNYTPDDSRKLLNGVAPSGSSRTKARREREAKEKRRRIGEAALRAVTEAGGDVGGLVEEGFFF